MLCLVSYSAYENIIKTGLESNMSYTMQPIPSIFALFVKHNY
jgi:hypothetical protein